MIHFLPAAPQSGKPKLLDQVKVYAEFFRPNSIIDGKVAVNNASKLDDTYHGGQAQVVPPFSRFQMVKSAWSAVDFAFAAETAADKGLQAARLPLQ